MWMSLEGSLTFEELSFLGHVGFREVEGVDEASGLEDGACVGIRGRTTTSKRAWYLGNIPGRSMSSHVVTTLSNSTFLDVGTIR